VDDIISHTVSCWPPHEAIARLTIFTREFKKSISLPKLNLFNRFARPRPSPTLSPGTLGVAVTHTTIVASDAQSASVATDFAPPTYPPLPRHASRETFWSTHTGTSSHTGSSVYTTSSATTATSVGTYISDITPTSPRKVDFPDITFLKAGPWKLNLPESPVTQ
jgi:hypothetical protein